MGSKLIRRGNGASVVGWGALLAVLAVPSAFADEAKAPEPAGTNQLTLTVDVRQNIEGTFVPYRYAFVTAGPEKYTFLVPETYRVDTSDPAKLKLASADYSVMITLGLVGDLAVGTKLDAASLQARVLAKYAEVAINAEQTSGANGQTVPALDFTWKAPGDVTRKSRTTYVPVAGGLMEFTLTASPDKFEASLTELNLVLLTFRTSSNGKFDYVVGSKFP